MRVAVVAGPGRTALLQELAEDGTGYAAPTLVNDLPAAVADYERAGPDRGGTERGEPVPGEPLPGEPVPAEPVPGNPVRWVWADTSTIYPSLLRSGVRVDRCHDIALTEALLRASGGTTPPSAQHPAVVRPAATPLLTGQAGLFGQAALFGQATLFGPAEPGIDEAREILSALVGVHADQLRRIAADPYPARFGLLAAVESAGGLSAAEMRARGMPWRADVHDALLEGLLGRRPGPGFRPPRLADLAAQISAAFGGRPVNPDSPAQVLKAFATEGISVSSTRSGVLRDIDHPAVPLLLEYKELARLHAAHGWSWLDEWVRDGRFHPEYLVGGVVSGRWASRGGGALQIPRVVRRAVVADPGWALVVADAGQLEPRVLAALAGDHAFAEAAGSGDLYQALAGAFGGDRGKAKVALLSAMYGGAGGEASQLLAVLRRRFPRADAYVEAAARAGEEGRVVRSRLGRACPPPSAEWRGARRRRPAGPALVAGPRPVHPELRGAGQRGRLGPGAAGRPAPPARGPGIGRARWIHWGAGRPGPGVLPARRGHRALPAGHGSGGGRRRGRGGRRSRPPAVRCDPGAVPGDHGRRRLLRGREMTPR